MSEVRVVQIKPLNGSIAGIWDYESSDYPDRVKIPMNDGTVVTYTRVIEQPHPLCLKATELCRKMNENIEGYRPKHGQKGSMKNESTV